MHELSLVQGLFDQASRIAEDSGATKVLKVVVEIGPFSGVVTESFRFAFDALKRDYLIFEDAVMEVETPPARLRCPACQAEEESCLPPADHCGQGLLPAVSLSMLPVCRRCGMARLVPAGGDDIVLLRMEME